MSRLYKIGKPESIEAFKVACKARRLRKRTRLSPEREQLATRIADAYGVTVLHLLDEQVERGPVSGRPRLNIIVDSAADGLVFLGGTWRSDDYESLDIEAAYIEILGKEAEGPPADGAVVVAQSLEMACLEGVMRRAGANHRDLINTHLGHRGLWQVAGYGYSTAIFLESDGQVRSVQQDGTWDRFRQSWFHANKPFDHMDYLTMDNIAVNLSSKEVIDRDYGGQPHNWFR